MPTLPFGPTCDMCGDAYEPNDGDDPPPGFCSWACWESEVIG